MNQKVFCIGLGKTGTSSLAKALEFMGYRVGRREQIFKKEFPNIDVVQTIKSKHLKPVFQITQKFDAFVDNPWPLLYRELLEEYPNAKFILTTRRSADWLRSAKKYFGTSKSKFRGLIYGEESIVNNEQLYLDTYQKHNQEVTTYFSNNPGNLLVLPLESHNKWALLQAFLEKETPDIPYPHANALKKSNGSLKWLKMFDLLYLEVILTLCIARALIVFIPFKHLAKLMAMPLKSGPSTDSQKQHYAKALQISQVVKSLSKRVPFRALCFEQALCTQMLLKKRGICSEIVFGVNKSDEKLAAHAWCIHNNVTLTGEKGKEDFTIVKSFATSSYMKETSL